MHIRVKVIYQSQQFVIDTSDSESILDLKNRVALAANNTYSYNDESDTNHTILIKDDNILSDKLTLKEYGIKSEDILIMQTQNACSCYLDIVFSLKDVWLHVYPVLDQIGTIMGVSCGAIGFGKWLMNKYKDKYKPSDLISIILAYDTWNHLELSNKLGLNGEDTKSILKGLGYKWNSHTKLYCASERTQEVFHKLYTIKLNPPKK